MASRSRVIYQSESLFASKDVNSVSTSDHTELIRIQDANYGFTINRTDVNQYGNLARIDSLVLEPPTVNLDFSYYLSNGNNEKAFGFNIDGTSQFVSGSMESSQGQNFYIVTSDEGEDSATMQSGDDYYLIGIGNAFLTEYNVEMVIGDLPKASVSFEASNINSQAGVVASSFFTGILPSVLPESGTPIVGNASILKPSDKGLDGPTAIRPGDVILSFPGFTGGGDESGTLSAISGAGGFHVQTASISIPLSRTPIEKIGSKFAFARVVDFPINATMSVNAIMNSAEAGNLAKVIAGCGGDSDKQVSINLKDCDGSTAMSWTLKGATLNSESWSSSIGSNKSVDLSFGVQLGGIDDLSNGIFFSGSYDAGNLAPSIELIPNQNNKDLDNISLQVSATDPEGDDIVYSAQNLPSGLEINSSNGLITGIIDVSSSSFSPYLTTINAVDDGIPQKTGISSFSWNVEPLNSAPIIQPIGNQSDTEGDVISLQISGSDPDEDSLTYSAVGLPSGLVIGSSNGLITGTIGATASTASPYSSTITVVDDGIPQLTGTANFNWTVADLNFAPIVDPISDQSDAEGDTISLQVSGYDPDGDTITYSAINLPPSLVIGSSDGLITGTIDQGTYLSTPYSTTINVVDDGSPQKTGTAVFNWNILPQEGSLTTVYTDVAKTTEVNSVYGDIPTSWMQNSGDVSGVTFGTSTTYIGQDAFQASNITEVDIPNNITGMGLRAFRSIGELTGISLGDGMIDVGNTSFQYAGNLQPVNLDLGNSVKSIGDSAFGNVNVVEVDLPDSLTGIGISAFYNNDLYTDISLGSNLISVENDAFAASSSLTGIDLSNLSDGNVLGWAFRYNYGLNELTIPDHFTTIPFACFAYCKNLSTVNFGTGLITIGGDSFNRCAITGTLNLPPNLATIGRDAFANGGGNPVITQPHKYTGINFPANNTLNYIGDKAFLDIDTLKYVDIPDTVTYLGVSTFYGCGGLTGVVIGTGIDYLNSNTFYGCALKSLDIPDGITGLGSDVFSFNASMTGISIGTGVKSIGASCFRYCTSLKYVNIPDSVNKIENSAFLSCGNITGATIGTGVNSIKDTVFNLCTGLNNVTINCPTGSWVGINAFNNTLAATYYVTGAYYQDYTGSSWSGDQGLAAGSQIICYGDGCPVAETPTIAYFDVAKTLEASGIQGDIPSNWMSNSGDISGVTFGTSASYINSQAFISTSLTDVTIPDNITGVGDEAFRDIDEPITISLGNGVKKVGTRSFYNAGAPITVDFGSSLEEIGQQAFMVNPIETINLPDSLLTIGPSAFLGNTGLTSISLPPNLVSVGVSAFLGGSQSKLTGIDLSRVSDGDIFVGETFRQQYSLKEVVIPDHFTEIGSMFDECVNLTGVSFGTGLKTINGNRTFYNTDLASVNLPTGLEYIGETAFQSCGLLTGVNFGDLTNLGYIGNSAFQSTAIETINLPDSLTGIGNGSFSSMSNLTSVSMPPNLISIGATVFQNNASLTGITINCPTGSWAGTNAFQSCPSGTYTITGAYFQDYTGSSWSGDQSIAAGSTFISGTY